MATIKNLLGSMIDKINAHTTGVESLSERIDELEVNGGEKNVVTSIVTGGAGGSGWRTDITTADGTVFKVPTVMSGNTIDCGILPLATDTNKGVISPTQKKKLDALPDSMSDYAKKADIPTDYAKSDHTHDEFTQLSEEIVDKVSQSEMEAYINETFLGGEW